MGADIDPVAFQALERRGFDAEQLQFKNEDFLSLPPEAFEVSGFDAVVGNPPYVRHHAFDEKTRQNAQKVKKITGVDLPMQANLWAFFLLHATQFLKIGGRAAFVLPQNFLHATYAEKVRAFLTKHFRDVKAFSIKEHLFENEGASEKSVLLFADGWNPAPQKTPSRLSVFPVDDTHIATAVLAGVIEPPNAAKRLEELDLDLRGTRRLGDLCNVRIGLVTGNSSFFLFNAEEAHRADIDSCWLSPIVSKADQVIGLTVTTGDLSRAFASGARTAILDTRSDRKLDPKVDEYLERLTDEQIETNATFKKRMVWHQPFDQYIGDAFFTGMSHISPRLVLNIDKLHCTNTLYRLSFSDEGIASRKQIALSLVSSFGQISAELEGRPYGSGLLKHEPSDVREIQVFVEGADDQETNAAFERADALLRAGQQAQATEVADHFFTERGFLSLASISLIKSSLLDSRRSRLRGFNMSQ